MAVSGGGGSLGTQAGSHQLFRVDAVSLLEIGSMPLGSLSLKFNWCSKGGVICSGSRECHWATLPNVALLSSKFRFLTREPTQN